MNPQSLMAALAGGGGGPAHQIAVDPSQHPDAPSAPSGGGDPLSALKTAINNLHVFVAGADDEADRQTALQCYAKLQSILANEQREKESAMGTTPAHKFMAKQAQRG